MKLREGLWPTLLQSVLRQGQTTEAGAANQHTTAPLQSIATITEEETATAIDGASDFSAAQVHAHMSVCK